MPERAGAGEADVEACSGCGLYLCREHLPGVKFAEWGHACLVGVGMGVVGQGEGAVQPA